MRDSHTPSLQGNKIKDASSLHYSLRLKKKKAKTSIIQGLKIEVFLLKQCGTCYFQDMLDLCRSIRIYKTRLGKNSSSMKTC